MLGKLSRNGKSTFSSILKEIMGTYYGQLPLSHFQTTQKPNTPQPYLLNIVGRRFIEMPEPEDSDDARNPPFMVGSLKAFSGRDQHSTRDLYGDRHNMVQFRPQGTLIFSTNNNLNFSKQADAGILNRLQYVEFRNWFGDDTDSIRGWDQKRPDCKKKDIRFAERIMSDEFLHSLFHHLLFLYKTYSFEGK